MFGFGHYSPESVWAWCLVFYFVIGIPTTIWYEWKLRKIDEEMGRISHSRSRAAYESAPSIVVAFMGIAWPIMLPFELITKFKNWRLGE